MDNDIAVQLNDQKAQLVKALSDAATSLHLTAAFAERFATIVDKVDFSDTPSKQHSQFLAILTQSKTLVEMANATNTTTKANGSKKRARDKKDNSDKPAKDPNAPKKPVTAYLMFQSKVRPEVKAKNPDLPNKELMGLMGTMWTELPDAEKAPYHEAVTIARAKHLKDVEEYEKHKTGSSPAPEEAAPAKAAAKPSKAKETKEAKPAKAAPAPAPASKSKTVAKPVVASPEESSEEESEDDDEEEDEEEEDDDDEEDEEPQPIKKKQKVDVAPVSKSSAAANTSAKKQKEKKK